MEDARQTLQTNRAAALLRLRSFPDVVSVCSEVLGKHRHCIKALARRAEGYIGLGNLVCDLHTIVVIYFDVQNTLGYTALANLSELPASHFCVHFSPQAPNAHRLRQGKIWRFCKP